MWALHIIQGLLCSDIAGNPDYNSSCASVSSDGYFRSRWPTFYFFYPSFWIKFDWIQCLFCICAFCGNFTMRFLRSCAWRCVRLACLSCTSPPPGNSGWQEVHIKLWLQARIHWDCNKYGIPLNRTTPCPTFFFHVLLQLQRYLSLIISLVQCCHIC